MMGDEPTTAHDAIEERKNLTKAIETLLAALEALVEANAALRLELYESRKPK